jgi:hypothetical protein
LERNAYIKRMYGVGAYRGSRGAEVSASGRSGVRAPYAAIKKITIIARF